MKNIIKLFSIIIPFFVAIETGISQTSFPDTGRNPGKIIMDDKIDTSRQIRDSVYTPDMIKSNSPDNRGRWEDDSLRRIDLQKNNRTDSIPKNQ
jgi:hypothetical protein